MPIMIYQYSISPKYYSLEYEAFGPVFKRVSLQREMIVLYIITNMLELVAQWCMSFVMTQWNNLDKSLCFKNIGKYDLLRWNIEKL